MSNENILLSYIIAHSPFIKECPRIVNEQPFLYFARATSMLKEEKCLFIGDSKYIGMIDSCTRMVVTDEETYQALKEKDCGFCITGQPRNLFFQMMEEYEQHNRGTSPKTTVGMGGSISRNASVSDTGVVIGNNVTIEDYVQIGSNTIIGDDTIICSGAKIGVQAFNIYEYGGKRKRLYHGGKTIIGKNVLISQNTVVEQALYSYGVTAIGDDTKIDANVLIGHNDTIGAKCEITAGTCLAGYVNIGDNTILRLGVLVRNGMKIGSNAHVGIGSVVVRHVRDGANMFGNPARNLNR